MSSPFSSALINGKPVVHFTANSTNGILRDTTLNLSGSNCTIFYVGDLSGTTNARLVAGDANNWLLGFHGGDEDRAYFTNWLSEPNTAADLGPRIYEGVISASGSAAFYGNAALLGTAASGMLGPNGIDLGGSMNANEPSTGNIGELLVFNTVLTTAQRLQVEQYLISNWTGILPGSTSVTITNPSGVLNLNGVNQTVGSINGVLGSQILTGTGTLTTGADNTSSWYYGTISGSGGLNKEGTGVLTLTNTNSSYSGPTGFLGGTVRIYDVANGGVTSSLGAASNAAGNLGFNGGTLVYLGSNSESTDRLFTLAGNATIDSSGPGTLSFSNSGSLAAAASGTLTLQGANTGANTFGPAIVDLGGGNLTTLTKAGVGTWILTNTGNTFSGGFNVTGGALGFSNSGALALRPTPSCFPAGSLSAIPARVPATSARTPSPSPTAGWPRSTCPRATSPPPPSPTLRRGRKSG